jgi:4-amino-4-deoxy-L-arabinose transferase-like glycosyltransferase
LKTQDIPHYAGTIPSGLLRSLLAFSIPLVVYLMTLAPSVVALDSAELTVAATTLGITRATGYPLYTLLGHAITLVPVGDHAFRLNLFSALAGALTVMLAERVMQKLSIRPIPALAAAGLLAFAPYFWSLSIVAEVYTLNTALIGASLLAALHWVEQPTLPRLALLGLLAGLGLSHHGSFALALPGVILLAGASQPRRFFDRHSLAVFAAAAAVGLLFYLYLPLRYLKGVPFNYAGHYDSLGFFHPVDLASLPGLWWLVSGRVFAGSMFSYSLPGLAAQAQTFFSQISRDFLFIGMGPAVLGAGLIWKKSCPLAATLLIIFTFIAAFYLNYDLPDKATMFLPCYLGTCLWIGIGFDALLDWMPGASHRVFLIVLQAIMLAGVLTACLFTWPGVDRSGDLSDRVLGEQILNSVEANAVVVGYWDIVPVLEYLTLVEGRRDDLLLINRFLISECDLHGLIQNTVGKRPFYIDERPDVLPEGITSNPFLPSLLKLEIQ